MLLHNKIKPHGCGWGLIVGWSETTFGEGRQESYLSYSIG